MRTTLNIDDPTLRELKRRRKVEKKSLGRPVADIHLAALLRRHGIKRLYTHDRDCFKFDFLRVVDPIAA